MNFKSVMILPIFAFVATSACCSEMAGVEVELAELYGNFGLSRDDAMSAIGGSGTDWTDTVLFEFTIPQRRSLYLAAIMSNTAVVVCYRKGAPSGRMVFTNSVDFCLLDSFRQSLRSHRYRPLSVTSGPKYVYVRDLGQDGGHKKFDFPWWVSSRRFDMPAGMLSGQDKNTVRTHEIYTQLFRQSVYPCIMKSITENEQ